MKKNLLFSSLFAGLAFTAMAQSPVQIIHNCPTPAASNVDIYLFDGSVWNPFAVITDLAFREATPYTFLPSGVSNLRVAIAPHSITGSINDTLASFAVPTLSMGQSYVAIAAGELGNNFDIFYDASSPTAGANLFNVNIFHGSNDAPKVAVFTNLDALNPVVTFGFGEFSGVATLPANDLIVALTTENINTLVEGFSVPLGTLNAGGAGGIVFASGYLAPTLGQPAFGLFAALPDGSVLPLPQVDVSRIQIAHNSPDPATAAADLWYFDAATGTFLGKELNVAFRSATPYELIPSDNYRVIVTAAGAIDTNSAVGAINANLLKNTTYQVIANGLVDPSQFPNANSGANFGFSVIAPARIQADDTTQLDVMVYHHSPDAPMVDVVLDANGAVLVNDMDYNQGTSTYLGIPGVGSPVINITPANDNNTVVAAYEVPAGFLRGSATTVLASGFLAPSGTEPAFGLWAVLPSGGVMVPLNVLTSSINPVSVSNLNAFPVPANTMITLEFNSNINQVASISIADLSGRVVYLNSNIEVAQGLNQINLPVTSLTHGLYLINLKGSNLNTSIKFVK